MNSAQKTIPSPRVVETFLLNLDEILDASVWLDQDQLNLRVTLKPESRWSETQIRTAFEEVYGVCPVLPKIVVMGGLYQAVVYVSNR